MSENKEKIIENIKYNINHFILINNKFSLYFSNINNYIDKLEENVINKFFSFIINN